MKKFRLEGVPESDLDRCVAKVEELERWARGEKVNRWAFRAAMLKALYSDADSYFKGKEGTFREIAAFDNGVAHALEELDKS